MIIVKTFPITIWFLVMCLYIIVVNCQEPSKEVTVTPEKYVDDEKPYMEFTCEAHLDKGDKLSWSITRNKTEETIALYEERDEKGIKRLDLQRPLISEDNNTEISCLKETVNGTKTKSENITISFQTDTGLNNSRESMWIWPSKTVIVYNDTTPVELACWAWMDYIDSSPDLAGKNISVEEYDRLYPNPDPKNGHVLSWYQIYGTTRPERIAMLPQINSYSYVKLNLWKIFKRIDNGTQIYCADETMRANLSSDNGTESHKMLLLYQEPVRTLCYPLDECRTLSKLGWMVAAVLLVLAVLAVISLAFASGIHWYGTKFCETSNKSKSN
ncbi:uncharacterized protein LOC134678025 [Cydia fagiglandana]|uniref:uncharacterized protein LOC134678025 n=1 Tax=Cydia fagiglandana TaxID=1458189 RepID=UPI002FEE1871